MSHKYKLTYFNVKARAEIIRYVFAQAGVGYDDVRISFEEWPKLKPKTLTGQLPELEVDGVVISESMAISRFLANEFGLAGNSAIDKAQADMIVDITTDLFPKLGEIFTEKDEDKKNSNIKLTSRFLLPDINQSVMVKNLDATHLGFSPFQTGLYQSELRKKFAAETLPPMLATLEKILKGNNNGDRFFVGLAVTWADLQVSLMLGNMDAMEIKMDLTQYPKLKALVERVENLPRIKEWMKNRPQTTM